MKCPECPKLKKIIKAQARLLVCYRIDSQPPEWVLDALAKYREMIDEMS